MRRRLLIALLTFAAVAVTGFAWPLLSSTAAERTQRLLIDRMAALDRFAVLAQQSITTGDPTTVRQEAKAYAALYHEDVLILEQRRPIVAAGEISAEQPGLGPLIAGALRNEPGQRLPQLRPWSRESVTLTRPIGTDTHISGVVALRISVSSAADDVTRLWALILAGAIVAALGFVALAMVFARWVLRPLAQLEGGVLAVTEGRQGTQVPGGGGPPELRALAVSFNRMSDAVVAASDKERQLVADASHQLRNPLAALRLRVDSLAPDVAPDAQAGYRSMAAEVERLESLLDGLLALASADQVAAHPEHDGTPWCWPDVVVLGRLDAWRLSAREADVELVDELPVAPEAMAPVASTDSELSQILDVLMDNAIRYAGSGATVSVSATLRQDSVELEVSDTGQGLSDEERARATQRFWRAARTGDSSGTGLGLAIADRLVTARGGSLRVLPNEPTGLTVRVALPRAQVGAQR